MQQQAIEMLEHYERMRFSYIALIHCLWTNLTAKDYFSKRRNEKLQFTKSFSFCLEIQPPLSFCNYYCKLWSSEMVNSMSILQILTHFIHLSYSLRLYIKALLCRSSLKEQYPFWIFFLFMISQQSSSCSCLKNTILISLVNVWKISY